MGTGEKLVSKSDEAFALLMYKNYIGKWKKQGNIKDDEDEQHEDDEDEQREEDEDENCSVCDRKKEIHNQGGPRKVHNSQEWDHQIRWVE